jgi:uncharacterized protein (DUF433 family)
MDWREHISADPAIMVGKPVIKGTRIPVEMILEHIAFGRTIEQVMVSWPRLTREDVLAALQYALEVYRTEDSKAPLKTSA